MSVMDVLGYTTVVLVVVASLYYVLYWRRQPPQVARRILLSVEHGNRVKKTFVREEGVRISSKEQKKLGLKLTPVFIGWISLAQLRQIANGRS